MDKMREAFERGLPEHFKQRDTKGEYAGQYSDTTIEGQFRQFCKGYQAALTHEEPEDMREVRWAENIILAIAEWKNGNDDGGGVIAKAESYARAAIEQRQPSERSGEVAWWRKQYRKLYEGGAEKLLDHGVIVDDVETHMKAIDYMASAAMGQARGLVGEDEAVEIMVKAAYLRPTNRKRKGIYAAAGDYSKPSPQKIIRLRRDMKAAYRALVALDMQGGQ